MNATNQAIVAHERVQEAIAYLRRAAGILKQAGARRALGKVRLALKSAEGAERHAYGRIVRARTEEP